MSWIDFEDTEDDAPAPAANVIQPSVPDDYIQYAHLCALWDEFKTEYDLCGPEIVSRFRREKDWCL